MSQLPVRHSGRTLQRRRFLAACAGLAGTAWLAACSSSSNNSTSNKPVGGSVAASVTSESAPSGASPVPSSVASVAAASPAVAASTDLNDKGWPKSITKLSIGVIPLEDAVQQKGSLDVLTKAISEGIGVPVDSSITTSYGALVQAQKNKQVQMGYYGALSFLLAEQQFGAIPILVDSPDGQTPGHYNSLLLAGKNSPVKTVDDIRGKDFSFVDPASTSGNLFPRVMLLQHNIDPNKDIKGRFAGSHENSILAIAKGEVPCGASNNISLQAAIDSGAIKDGDLVILQKSDDIPNGPFAVNPDLDRRAVGKLIQVMTSFKDPTTIKQLELVGPLVPVQTSYYDFVRQAAKVLNLQFTPKGDVVIPTPTP